MNEVLNFIQPKDAWDKLSMREKAEMMKVAVKNGIYNLNDIREKYNEFAKGGSVDTDWSYNSWKRQIAEHMGIKPDEDNTYDYEAYFKKYPEEAWKMLKGDPTAHFSDEFKTVYHPTFSSKSVGNDGSIYSGVINTKTNPQGLVGGTWSPDYKTFTMSPDGYRGPVSMDERKWYLENAEDNGVQLREADGSLPIYDGIPWGGVLPNVTIHGNRHSLGGPLVEAAMNEYKKGGGIHIKKKNRGKFTRLKERTGHSASWFKEHGTPAQKKMATFELNARHWKHGLGGNLFDGTSQPAQKMQIGLDVQGWPNYTLEELLEYANTNNRQQQSQLVPNILMSNSDLVKGSNINSNYTVGDYAKSAGEAAIRERERQRTKEVARFNTQNEMHSLFPIGIVSGETVYGHEENPKVIGLSGADPIGEFYVAGEALGPLFKGANAIAKWGDKYITNHLESDFTNASAINLASSSNKNSIGLNLNKDNGLFPAEGEETIYKYANSQENPIDLIYKRMSNPTYAAKIKRNSDPLNSSQQGAIFFEGIDPYNWDSQQAARNATSKWWGENEEDLNEAYGRVMKVNIGLSGIANELPFANPPSPFIYMPDKTTFFNLPMFTEGALETKNREMLYNIIKAHELAHNISTPNIPSPLFERLKDDEYFSYLNNREVAARGTQIKNYFNKEEITGDELKYAAKHYSEDTGVDNNMSHLFEYIEEEAKNDPMIWEKMAKWISDVSPIGLLTLTPTNNDKE